MPQTIFGYMLCTSMAVFYLDTDVEVLKDFSPLLAFKYVLGMENSDRQYIEAATFGSLP